MAHPLILSYTSMILSMTVLYKGMPLQKIGLSTVKHLKLTLYLDTVFGRLFSS